MLQKGSHFHEKISFPPAERRSGRPGADRLRHAAGRAFLRRRNASHHRHGGPFEYPAAVRRQLRCGGAAQGWLHCFPAPRAGRPGLGRGGHHPQRGSHRRRQRQGPGRQHRGSGHSASQPVLHLQRRRGSADDRHKARRQRQLPQCRRLERQRRAPHLYR